MRSKETGSQRIQNRYMRSQNTALENLVWQRTQDGEEQRGLNHKICENLVATTRWATARLEPRQWVGHWDRGRARQRAGEGLTATGHRVETGLGNEGRVRAGFLTQEEAGILRFEKEREESRG